MPKVLCFGSVNVDDVFVVPDIVRTGETIASSRYAVHPGGKGANQSVALALAGAHTFHAGRIGKDGVWVADLMKTHGVDTSLLSVDDTKPNGRAIIQVSAATNDNAIVLLPGTNHAISLADADKAIAAFEKGDWVVMQNEINLDAANRVLELASNKGMVVVFNPAPCPSDFVAKVNVQHADILILNAPEAASIANQLPTESGDAASLPPTNAASSERETGARAAAHLLRALPHLALVVVTLGGDGAIAAARDVALLHVPALAGVSLVDTTGAGDTFVGYFVASLIKLLGSAGGVAGITPEVVQRALKLGTTAGGMACEKQGAMPSVPRWADVEARAAA